MLLRMWLDDFSKTIGVRVVNLILFDVVGPRDHRNKLFNNLLTLKKGDTIELTSCEQKVYFCPVENVIHAINSSINNDSIKGCYFIKKPNFMSLKFYIEFMREIIDSSLYIMQKTR